MRIIIYDRIFWIYFMVTIFFLIIGLNFIISNATITNKQQIIISMFWAISIINIFIVVYYLTYFIAGNTNDCINTNNISCLSAQNRSLCIINIVFIIILFLATIWTSDFKQPLLGVSILIAGLIICAYSYPYPIVFWLALTFLLLWLTITVYSL